MANSELSGTVKGSNGVPLTSDLAELRRRLAQSESLPATSIFNNGLSSIQISKVTNGQPPPHIPDSGINLKGTSVTLTKIRNPEPHNMPQQQQQLQQHYEDAKGSVQNGSATTKSKKKKKKGMGVRQSGDDWNLVGEN